MAARPSGRYGRKPLLLARQLSTAVMNCLLASRPSYHLFLAVRTMSMFTYHIGSTRRGRRCRSARPGPVPPRSALHRESYG